MGATKRTITARDYYVASHEAGHAVAALALGIPVAGCTIEPDEGSDGALFHKGRTLGDLSELMEGLTDLAVMVVCGVMAGAAADVLMQTRQDPNVSLETAHENFTTEMWTWDGERDVEKMTKVRALMGPEGWAAIVERARLILETHYDAWQATSDALIERRTLDGHELRRLFDTATTTEEDER